MYLLQLSTGNNRYMEGALPSPKGCVCVREAEGGGKEGSRAHWENMGNQQNSTTCDAKDITKIMGKIEGCKHVHKRKSMKL